MSKLTSVMIPINIHNIKDIIIALRDSDNFLKEHTISTKITLIFIFSSDTSNIIRNLQR